jgi:glycogen synthase
MLFGMISRLTDQKGLDLILAKAEELLKADVQLVFLGTGDVRTENALHELAHRFPQKVGVRIGFDEGLAHRIEAGSDAYLMPSRFEPCGLNQMYSMRYGTVPVVHGVGGLADTVVDYTPGNPGSTGFVMADYTPAALLEALGRALTLFLAALHDELTTVFTEKITARSTPDITPAIAPPLLAAMIASMLITALRTWIDAGTSPPADVIDRMFHTAARAALRAGLRPART